MSVPVSIFVPGVLVRVRVRICIGICIGISWILCIFPCGGATFHSPEREGKQGRKWDGEGHLTGKSAKQTRRKEQLSCFLPILFVLLLLLL